MTSTPNDRSTTEPEPGPDPDADEHGDDEHAADDNVTTVVDAVVLGMGPGGEDLGGRLARAGWNVVGIEASLLGGECPFWGCVPSKMMLRGAHLLAEARRVDGVAGTATVTPDWGPVATRIREDATNDWDDTESVERFVGWGGTFVRGRGRLVALDTALVEDGDAAGHRYRATKALVVATGTTPAVPPITGLDATPFWTNRDAVQVTELPGSMIVLGGGAIGVELAQVFARFGVRVTLVESADRLVPAEEPAVGEILAGVFADEGIDVVVGHAATRVSHDGAFHMTLDDDRTVTAERLLVATGRRIDLAAIGAEVLGVDVDEVDALPTDEHLRVTDRVWAVGDVTGKGAFTHIAIHQAKIAAADILGRPHTPASYHAVPRVTFTDPEIGSVGLSEQAARDAGIDVVIGRAETESTARGWLHDTGNRGLIQLVVDRDHDVLVGATSMGPAGGEVLGLLALAVHARLPLQQLRTMIYAYPTFHGGVADALKDLS